MTTNHLEQWLNSEVDDFPSRLSGEDLYEFVVRLSREISEDSREDFVIAMTNWLRLRSEPKTMLAVELIACHRLSELTTELEALLDDVSKGVAFKPFYDAPIKKTLAMI